MASDRMKGADRKQAIIEAARPLFAKNGFNEGRLKNFSRTGLFIDSKARLSVGEIITIGHSVFEK